MGVVQMGGSPIDPSVQMGVVQLGVVQLGVVQLGVVQMGVDRIRLNLGRHSSAGPEISHRFSFDREVNGEGDVGKGRSWKQPDDVEKKEKKMSCHSGSLIVIVGRA